MEIFERESLIVLDSSVWIAYLHEEDSQHKKARELVGELTNPLIVPAEVLSEVATALRNKKREDLAKGFTMQVISGVSPLLVSNEDTVRRTAEVFVARKDKLSFTDTALLALARSYQVITFDRDLRRAIEQGN